MKKQIITLAFIASIFISEKTFSQGTGFNTTGSNPNASAGVDIDFNNKGLLIPRVSLTSNTDISTIASPAISLLVYNTNTGLAGGAGFYFWDGAKWEQLAYGMVGNPPGTVISFAGASTPPGYLSCDGFAVSRTTYAALFSAIGTAWGSGDNSTTFNLPDLRGRFMRGVDGIANNDPDKAIRAASNTGGNTGNLVGSLQQDNFAMHSHNLLINNSSMGNTNAGSTSYLAQQAATGGQFWHTTQNFNNTSSIQSMGGNETRPKNVGVNYIIKY